MVFFCIAVKEVSEMGYYHLSHRTGRTFIMVYLIAITITISVR